MLCGLLLAAYDNAGTPKGVFDFSNLRTLLVEVRNPSKPPASKFCSLISPPSDTFQYRYLVSEPAAL